MCEYEVHKGEVCLCGLYHNETRPVCVSSNCPILHTELIPLVVDK